MSDGIKNSRERLFDSVDSDGVYFIMDSTTFFARFWGLFFLVISLVFLIQPKSLTRWIQFLQEKSFLYVNGYIAILLGLMTIAGHNKWVLDWRILITLIGWSAVVKGAGRLLVPERAALAEEQYEQNEIFVKCGFLILLLLGTFLIYKGFFGSV